MTTLRQIELESFFLISIVAVISLFFVIQRNNQGQFNVASSMSVNSPLAANPTQDLEQNIFFQISPDGSKKVLMKVTQNNDNMTTYDFSAMDGNDANKHHIFTKTLDSLKSMTLPYNTWSPDNKYFFIQENTESGKSVLAFNASGEAFSDTEEYFDVTDLFRKKETGNNFAEATGWASESLIIINTTKEDGTKGPSYWFEIPSRAIIQLSTKF